MPGFGRFIFELAGDIVGEVTKGTANAVGTLVGSDFIKEVGATACEVTKQTGRTVGTLADGAGGLVRGTLNGDPSMQSDGAKEVGTALTDVVVGVASGVKGVVQNGGEVVSGLREGDTKRAGVAARNLAKVAAVSVLAVGAVEIFDGVDGVDAPGGDVDFSATSETEVATVAAQEISIDEPGIHFVEPHYVSGYTTDTGMVVDPYFRDGDGDTSVNLTQEEGGGYLRSNPDGNLGNNLRG